MAPLENRSAAKQMQHNPLKRRVPGVNIFLVTYQLENKQMSGGMVN